LFGEEVHFRRLPLHDKIDIGALAHKALHEALRERGHVNILIAGRTGVGKSSLINAVFQGNMAKTGQGRPVTQETREITKADIPLSIFDTRGLELKEFDSIMQALKGFVAGLPRCQLHRKLFPQRLLWKGHFEVLS
jgi:ribosome biogenesis GTPase A